MEHRAYEFDWATFDTDLRPILADALGSNDTSQLLSYIDTNISELTDPYEGLPLTSDWQSQVEHIDEVHTLGDFALTRFYNPVDDFGVGDAWTEISDALNESCQVAMLGQTVGPTDNPFDPGRMGSYFQSPNTVVQSIVELAAVNDPKLADYLSLLNACRSKNRGVYVTF